MNTFKGRSWMFINYLVHEFVEFMVVHELAFVHEFMTVHEQHMFMNKVRVREQNKFMNSWTFMKVSFVVQEYSWTVHEHVDQHSWTFIVFCSRAFRLIQELFMNVHEQFMIISPGRRPHFRVHLTSNLKFKELWTDNLFLVIPFVNKFCNGGGDEF